MRWYWSLKRQQLAAMNPETSAAELARFVRSSDKWIAEAAAANPSLPADSIIEAVGIAFEHSDDDLLAKLAGNPSLSADLMREIIFRGSERCLWALVRNPSLPADLMYEIIPRGSRRCLVGLINHPNLPTDLMLKYVRGADHRRLVTLAEHPNADVTVLIAVCHKAVGLSRWERRVSVMRRAVVHQACNIELVKWLYGSGFWFSIAFLQHSDLPSDIIDALFDNHHAALEYWGDSTVDHHVESCRFARQALRGIAAHPNTSLHVLTVLAMGPNRRLAEKALGNIQKRREADPAFFDKQAALSAAALQP